MNIFEATDYKDVLREKINEGQGQRGYQSRLAEKAGCQKSFLSQVLHSHVHVTPDHAAGMAKFWALSPDEAEYFLELVHLARAGSEDLRRIIQSRLQRLRASNSEVTTRYSHAGGIDSVNHALYYSSWQWSAIHILLTIPSFQTEQAIAGRLGIAQEEVRRCLHELERMGLAIRVKSHWLPGKTSVHLPRESPLTAMNHFNWRNRAVLDSQAAQSGSLHYTAVHSLSQADFHKIREQLLGMLDRTRAIIAPSAEEDLACLTVDWFRP